MSFSEDIVDLVARSETGLIAKAPSWSRVPLGDVVGVLNGFPFKSSMFNAEEGAPVIRIRDVTSGSTKTRFTGEVPDGYWVEDGELIVGMDGDFNSRIWLGGTALLNQRVCKLTPDTSILDLGFLARVLPGYLDLINRHTSSVTVKHLSSRTLQATPIPLPPLAEQKRIVAKLDRLSARSGKAKGHLAAVQTLATRAKQATLAAAFRGELTADWRETATAVLPPVTPREVKRRKGKVQDAPFEAPFVIPKDWRWLRLPELGDLDRGKSKHRPRNDPALYGDDHPFVQTGDVRAADRYLSTFSKSYSAFGLAQSRLWPLGTVCITIAANIAETAILSIDACFPDSVVGFSADHERTSPEYVEYFIRTVRDELSAYAPATAQKNINLETLYGVRVPTPPLPEQTEIVRRIETAFAKIDRMAQEASRAADLLDRLDQQLLAKAFRGELVPQDPSDEPASALLARIHEARANAPKPKRRRKSAKA